MWIFLGLYCVLLMPLDYWKLMQKYWAMPNISIQVEFSLLMHQITYIFYYVYDVILACGPLGCE